MPLTRLAPFTAPPAQVVAALDALRERHEVPETFPPEALTEAEAAAAAWAEGGPERLLDEGARDARDLALVTIDPPGSMDLDQAVLLERLIPDLPLDASGAPANVDASDAPGAAGSTGSPAGAAVPAYRVTYAIASLATFVTPDGALDAELHRRGSTVYAPDRAVPLHPEVLSHGAASLLPDVDRPACLWTIELDAVGRGLSARVERALVRSRARLSYDQVQEAVNAGPESTGRLPAAVPRDLPELLRTIGTLRQVREAARGGVSLAAPEQEIERVAPASGYRLTMRAPLPVEEWNAQISLLTGISAARIMVDAGVGILRTMPPAQSADYARLRRAAEALSIDWPDSQPYADLVHRLDHAVPAHAAFMDQALSLFRGAGYLAFGVGGVGVPDEDEAADTEEAIHAAIAARYAHVTAPLRRLVDRYGQEVCIAACSGRPVPEWVRRALPGMPDTMDVTGRRARAVSRGAVTVLEALVLAGHEGEVFDGVITSVREGRGEVVLAAPGVVGSVRAPSGRSVPLGEAVRVRLVSVDVVEGRIGLELA